VASISVVTARPLFLLASTSPRRRQLLTEAGLPFALCEPGPEYDVGDEHSSERGEPLRLAAERARRKASGSPAAASLATGGLPVLGVDTVVDLDGVELGKPRDAEEARRMLLRLAGRDHRVHTAHCLVDARRGRIVERLTSATVTCRQPACDELEAYLASGEWRGKAGAYGIQDGAQGFLALVDGDFDTVVGLSVVAVRSLLADLGGEA
jgi:septum formation protein